MLVCALAPAVLLLGHLLPADGPGLAVRLAGAAACVLLLPGAVLLRAVAWPASPSVAVAASFALSLAVVTVAWGLVFAVGSSIELAIAVIVAFTVCAAVVAALRGESRPAPRSEGRALLAALGLAVPFAGVVWWSSGAVSGDAYFHLARMQKLAELDSLTTLTTVSEFKDGGLHPGYAFPLWQGVDALIARFAGVDVVDALVYLPAVFVLLAFALAFAAGSVVFRSNIGALVLVGAQTAYFGFYWGVGNLAGTGFFEMSSQPQAASHLLLATATLALAFAFMAEGGWTLLACAGAAGLSLTLIHPTYTPFVVLLLAGFVVARVVILRSWEAALTRAAFVVGVLLAPLALYVVLVLPVLRDTGGWTPSSAVRARDIAHYGNAFTTIGDWIILSPDSIVRAGAVVIAGLLAVPLAGFAARRTWAALVLGGSLAVLIFLLVPPLFTALSDALSLSQARRLAQFLPIAFALTGGCIVVARLRGLGVALAGGVSVALLLLYPGEFGYVYEEGGPGWILAVVVVGAGAALIAGALRRPLGPDPDRWTAAVAVAFLVPVAVAGLKGLEGSPPLSSRLTPGIIGALEAETAPGDVVFSDRRTAYVAAGFAPVYINASSPGHAAETRQNRPGARANAAWRFFHQRRRTDAERWEILERQLADWVLVDKRQTYPEEFVSQLPLVFEDDRFALYRVSR